ncbi:hypothetical protein BMETH_1311_2 [methanotrophic bacterial endosymbiont of Bathymodiolus sp.]|nr:hypothetical protein BMETH_1311_2 [methanotrophic bacterial endosymbiont of Bathymodiolus sp.]
MPNIAIATILMYTIDNRLNCIDLVGAHNHKFLLAGHQDHIAADHLTQGAFGKKVIGKVVQLCNFCIVFAGELINRQKAFVSIKAKVLAVVV